MVRLPAGSVSNLIQFNLSCSSLIRGSRGKKKKKKEEEKSGSCCCSGCYLSVSAHNRVRYGWRMTCMMRFGGGGGSLIDNAFFCGGSSHRTIPLPPSANISIPQEPRRLTRRIFKPSVIYH